MKAYSWEIAAGWLTPAAISTICFRASPPIIRAMLPKGVVGVYTLFKGEIPFYVGRSDTCLQERLCTHEKLIYTSYFAWYPCKNSLDAFYLESALFHSLFAYCKKVEQIHPARPKQHNQAICPFCTKQDKDAFIFSLNSLLKQKI